MSEALISRRAPESQTRCVRFRVRGAVQGVGFRPFVYAKAIEHRLTGWVRNDARGVLILAEGDPDAIQRLEWDLLECAPVSARVESVEREVCAPNSACSTFSILPSEGGAPRTGVVPDLATCPDCLAEIQDPANRRYGYPFTNCTHCGPRYSIIEAIPYDRAHTSMSVFEMCEACRAEYEDPGDRRFHAQPNACPDCGPRVRVLDAKGEERARDGDAIDAAADALAAGEIVAFKSIGGFQLLADAGNDAALRRLRARKQRPRKPFAMMVPSREHADTLVDLSDQGAAKLLSPIAPIVLAPIREGATGVSDALAPGCRDYGVMLPFTPLHHLLMARLKRPLVATSGNLSEEPICIDDAEALRRLGTIADAFVVHDRRIVRQVDDSIVRQNGNAPVVTLRVGRGLAPLSLPAPASSSPLLAVGAHLKNTIAIIHDEHLILSQHIGDLATRDAIELHHATTRDLLRLHRAEAPRVACDLHPDYASTEAARGYDPVPEAVQHHVAHALAGMFEHELQGPVLGVSWDGTGYGADGDAWGGECFVCTREQSSRVASLLPFRLPGGDAAVKDPARQALGLLAELEGASRAAEDLLARGIVAEASALSTLVSMLEQNVNCPRTSSAGRLFDATASLLGFRGTVDYEGEAAMWLERLAAGATDAKVYAVDSVVGDDGVLRLDWRPMLRAIAAQVAAGQPCDRLAARFHNSLAAAILQVAQDHACKGVVLSGGCFQNRVLSLATERRLAAAGFDVYTAKTIPPNDAGIACGQAAALAWNHRYCGDRRVGTHVSCDTGAG